MDFFIGDRRKIAPKFYWNFLPIWKKEGRKWLRVSRVQAMDKARESIVVAAPRLDFSVTSLYILFFTNLNQIEQKSPVIEMVF